MHRDFVVEAENLLDVAGIAFRAVADENLIGIDLDAALRVVVLADRLDEERISLLRSIAVERLFLCHFIHSFMHCLDADLRQWLRDITDAQPNDVCFRMGFFISRDSACNFREKIAARQLLIILVNRCHEFSSSFDGCRLAWHSRQTVIWNVLFGQDTAYIEVPFP